MTNPVLTFDNVTISYGSAPVLRGVSLELCAGEVVAVTGASGCGKSTLLRAAMGLLPANGTVTAGSIRFRGRDISELTARDLREVRGAGMGMVFQDAGRSFAPVRTVGDQLIEELRAHGPRIGRGEARDRALSLLAKLGFTAEEASRVWGSYPFELSGGMAQRVGVAAAALLEPAVILADEPTSALDPVSRDAVLAELRRLRDNFGTAILLVTHDVGVADALADRVLRIDGGMLVESDAASSAADRRGPWPRAVAFSPDAEPVMEAAHLTKTYARAGRQPLDAVRGVDIALRPGEAVGLLGPSGCGKTTLACLLARLIDASTGSIVLDGRDITRLTGRALRVVRPQVQMVFQSPTASFDPRYTLLDGVAESLCNQGVPRAEARARAEELLIRCGLDASLALRRPGEVSGGQCQRAAVARALAPRPRVLICDEATSSLDAASRDEAMDLLAAMRDGEFGPAPAILFISHDESLTRAFCDRVLTMHDGRLRG